MILNNSHRILESRLLSKTSNNSILSEDKAIESVNPSDSLEESFLETPREAEYYDCLYNVKMDYLSDSYWLDYDMDSDSGELILSKSSENKSLTQHTNKRSRLGITGNKSLLHIETKIAKDGSFEFDTNIDINMGIEHGFYDYHDIMM